jgi:hypothetical protein
MLVEPGDLQCQKCLAVYPWRGSKALTEAAARFRDWRVFEGVTHGGAEMRVVLCPEDSGVVKKGRHRAHDPIVGQEAFDI